MNRPANRLNAAGNDGEARDHPACVAEHERPKTLTATTVAHRQVVITSISTAASAATSTIRTAPAEMVGQAADQGAPTSVSALLSHKYK